MSQMKSKVRTEGVSLETKTKLIHSNKKKTDTTKSSKRKNENKKSVLVLNEDSEELQAIPGSSPKIKSENHVQSSLAIKASGSGKLAKLRMREDKVSVKKNKVKTHSRQNKSDRTSPSSKQNAELPLDQSLESALDHGSESCRNGQVIRIYRVLTLLENSRFGLSAKDLTEIISNRGTPVHERTIYRDLEVLRSSGFPLEEKKSDKKSSSKWRVLKYNSKSSPQLSLKEIFSLYLAQNYLKPLEKTPFFGPIRSVFDKLTRNISSEAVQALASIGDELHFESGSLHALGIDEKSFQTARLAIGERQILSFDYFSTGSRKTKRKCGPQFLYFAKGGLYLIAQDMKDKVFKTFAFPRIKNAEMLDEAYDEPMLEPKTYFQYCFGVYKASEPEKIVLKFSPEISGFVKERRWHESQINRTLNSGELEVQLFVGVTPELTQWVLGFGSHVYVSEPLSLRKQMAEEISRMQKIY